MKLKGLPKLRKPRLKWPKRFKRKEDEETEYAYDYEEYDDDPRHVILQQRKKEKRRLYQRIAIVIVISLLMVGYFLSDLSKIQSITIEGNNLVETSIIEEALSVDKSSVFLTTSASTLKRDVESIDLIESVKVKKGLFGTFRITVTEKEVVAFTEFDDVTYIIDSGGGVTRLTEAMYVDNMNQLPHMAEFASMKLIKQFAKQYVLVPELIRNSISDIVYAPEKADETRVRLILTNSKELIVRIENMAENLSEENFNFEGYMDKYSAYRYFIFEGRFIRVSN